MREIITDKCGDYSDAHATGDCYVYVWLDENKVPFYVGSGSLQRAETTNPSTRSTEFREKLNDKCSIRLVAKGLHPRFKYAVERFVTLDLVEAGFSLTNKYYRKAHKHWGNDREGYVRRCGEAVKELINIANAK